MVCQARVSYMNLSDGFTGVFNFARHGLQLTAHLIHAGLHLMQTFLVLILQPGVLGVCLGLDVGAQLFTRRGAISSATAAPTTVPNRKLSAYFIGFSPCLEFISCQRSG